jgi:hypothetical protein
VPSQARQQRWQRHQHVPQKGSLLVPRRQLAQARAPPQQELHAVLRQERD